jgi:hypothetical protein
MTGSDVSHVIGSDISHVPCPEVCSAHAQPHTQGNPEGGQVTSGSHVTTTKKKARGKIRACAEPTSD